MHVFLCYCVVIVCTCVFLCSFCLCEFLFLCLCVCKSLFLCVCRFMYLFLYVSLWICVCGCLGCVYVFLCGFVCTDMWLCVFQYSKMHLFLCWFVESKCLNVVIICLLWIWSEVKEMSLDIFSFIEKQAIILSIDESLKDKSECIWLKLWFCERDLLFVSLKTHIMWLKCNSSFSLAYLHCVQINILVPFDWNAKRVH